MTLPFVVTIKICVLSAYKDQGHLQKGYSHKSLVFFS